MALARKWRPRQFDEVVGQEHVVQALGNALDSGRIHHAFLFEGTRGVGKTTIARIFAKALNCEQGVSSKPCGECSACVSVDEGRFVDLLEVDAASRTRVDDTRELLDNVQYAPTSGRYKVYLIDEVHMLSTHSFNALLKTLEEPPEHVKFLLATTDPQKLPVTILSRCLQFGLRALNRQQIETQLGRILKDEEIAFDDAALGVLSRAADGSMRDALSLLDQAIAQGENTVQEATVRSMLGTISGNHLGQLIDVLCASDAVAMTSLVNEMLELSVDFGSALNELLINLYHASLYQQAPEAFEALEGNTEAVTHLADVFAPEHLQLLYQIGISGKRDLHLAPDSRTGFEMTLLRMLAFEPDSGQGVNLEKPAESAAKAAAPVDPGGRADKPAQAPETAPDPVVQESIERIEQAEQTTSDQVQEAAPPPPSVTAPAPVARASGDEVLVDGRHWYQVVEELDVKGLARELAMHCALAGYGDGGVSLQLAVENESLYSDSRKKAIHKAFEAYTGKSCLLDIELAALQAESPAVRRQREQDARLEQTRESMLQSEGVNDLMNEFGASIRESSIQPAAQDD